MNPADRTLKTSRKLPYSPQAIYNAFSSPALLAMWWGPEGFSNTFEVFDFTAGGRWKFVMRGPDGKEYPNDSIFVELVPDAKVVIEHPLHPHFTLTIELTSAGDGTLLSWEQVFEDAQTAQAVQHRAGPANEQNIDRLMRVLGASAQSAQGSTRADTAPSTHRSAPHSQQKAP